MKTTLDTSGKQIQRQAAKWLALRQACGFTTAEHATFAEWRNSDSRHAEIFEEVEAAWGALDQLARYPHSADVAANPDLLRPARMKARIFVFPKLAVAAAAAIALTATVIWKPWAGSDSSRRQSAAAVESRILRLPDGSVAELNVGARVVEQFAPTERRVWLMAGEAHFTVAKNPDRPFIVQANGVAVRAVGTAFDVRLASSTVEVLVTEGIVQVQPPAGPSATALETPTVLTVGQRTVVSTLPQAAAPVVETVPSSVVGQTLAWQTSRFIFDNMPLSEVVERFNRSGAKTILVVDDPRLATMKFSGRVRAASVDDFVEVLESTFGVSAERRGDGRIVLRKAR